MIHMIHSKRIQKLQSEKKIKKNLTELYMCINLAREHIICLIYKNQLVRGCELKSMSNTDGVQSYTKYKCYLQ